MIAKYSFSLPKLKTIEKNSKHLSVNLINILEDSKSKRTEILRFYRPYARRIKATSTSRKVLENAHNFGKLW